MITSSFAPYCRRDLVETHEFETYKAFFDFYLEHCDKGVIFDVKEIKLEDAMQELFINAARQFVKQEEEIIREVVRQGYKYLGIKREFSIENNMDTFSYTAKCNFTYCGFDSLVNTDEFRELGYEIYDLSKVAEYLRDRTKEE